MCEYRVEGGGFVFLADPFFDAAAHDFLVKIIWGPEGLEPREVAMRRGMAPATATCATWPTM